MADQTNAGTDIDAVRREAARERALRELVAAIHRQPTPEDVRRCATDGLCDLLGVPAAALERARHGARDLLVDDDWALVDYVDGQADRAVAMLDGLARTARAARHAQAIVDVTAQLDPTGSVDDILATAVQALHAVLDGFDVSLRLEAPAPRTRPGENDDIEARAS